MSPPPLWPWRWSVESPPAFEATVKRSRRVKLVLIGGLSAGAVAGCSPSANAPPALTISAVYTNNYYVPGAGYYHAPYRAWYSLPYNYFDPQAQRYYYGGQWGPSPEQSITNVSSPTVLAVQQAQGTRTDVQRGGFGSSSHTHSIWS